MDTTGEKNSPDRPRRRAERLFRVRIESVAATGLLILAICYTLYVAREILMPFAVALILALFLQPFVRALNRIKIPDGLAAALVVATVFAVSVLGIYVLADPAAKWLAQMPDIINDVQNKIKSPIEEIQDAKEQVENLVENGEAVVDQELKAGAEKKAPAEPALETPLPPAARVGLFEIVTRALAVLRDVGWSVIIIVVLLFFLLATSTATRENIVMALPTLSDKKRALTVTADIQKSVSAYLATVILINIGLGVAIGIAMYLIGLPNPILWGVMAAALNFIPYLGAIAGSLTVGIVGLLTFATPIEALVPPVLYVGVNAVEAYLVTPLVLGRRLTLNPVAVFVSVIFWAWIWGVVGAILAVPILACLKVICDSIDRLAPLSQFLGGRRPR